MNSFVFTNSPFSSDSAFSRAYSSVGGWRGEDAEVGKYAGLGGIVSVFCGGIVAVRDKTGWEEGASLVEQVLVDGFGRYFRTLGPTFRRYNRW